MKHVQQQIISLGMALGLLWGLFLPANAAGKPLPSESLSSMPKHRHAWDLEAVEMRLSKDNHGVVATLPFEDVMMESNKTIPYVSLDSVFNKMLGYHVTLTITTPDLALTSKK